jgi:hypothetical protein
LLQQAGFSGFLSFFAVSKRDLKNETFEKCSILLKVKSKIPDFERGKTKILTIPVPSAVATGQASGKIYIEYFED